MIDYLRLVWTIARKDVMIELRTHERLAAMGAFAVLVGVLFNFAIDTSQVRPRPVRERNARDLLGQTSTGIIAASRAYRYDLADPIAGGGNAAGILLKLGMLRERPSPLGLDDDMALIPAYEFDIGKTAIGLMPLKLDDRILVLNFARAG